MTTNTLTPAGCHGGPCRRFTGFVAWVLWLSVHIAKLIGFRNRLLVLISGLGIIFSSSASNGNHL